MGDTYLVEIGAGGEIVLPADLRQHIGWVEGTPLVLLETASSLELLARDQLRDRVRGELDGLGLCDVLLAERRAEARAEDVEGRLTAGLRVDEIQRRLRPLPRVDSDALRKDVDSTVDPTC